LQSIKEEGGGERLFAEPLPRQTKNKKPKQEGFFCFSSSSSTKSEECAHYCNLSIMLDGF
jgi:hypothetical protein